MPGQTGKAYCNLLSNCRLLSQFFIFFLTAEKYSGHGLINQCGSYAYRFSNKTELRRYPDVS